MKRFALLFAFASTSLLASLGRAQTPPPATPPGTPIYMGNPNLAYPPSYAPRELDYREGAPIPRGYHVESHINKPVAIAGASALGGFWLVSVLGAFGLTFANEALGGTRTEPRDMKLAIPVVGPFVMLADKDAPRAEALYVSLGVGQIIGVLVAGCGLLPSERFVRNDVAKPRVWPTPIVTATSRGFGLAGTF